MSFEKELDQFLEKETKIKKIKLIVSLMVGTPAWIAIFIIDWKIAVCLFFIMFANNLSNNN